MEGIPDEIMELLNKLDKTPDECGYILDWFRNNKDRVNKALTGKPFMGNIDSDEPTSSS